MFDAKSQAHIIQILFAVGISLLILPLQSTVLAAGFSGPVVSVLDGDTIEVLHNQHPERIRLSGIDCPEKGTDILRADCSRQDVWPGFLSVRNPFMGLRQ